MNFLYPQFLYGLLALSIPIIVHLFNFRRTKRIYFSNTLFLKKVKESSSSKLRVKHYLILLSRLLFLFFLVMAFAQPIIKSGDDQAIQSDDMLIYLDNSYSMSNEVDESTSAMDEGVAYINEILRLFPTATNYRVLTNDFDASSRIARSSTELSDFTTELSYSSATRSFTDIYDRINTLQDKPEAIYWISDFQRSTSGSGISVDSAYHISLIPLTFVNTQNVAVDSIWLENPFIIGDEKLQLHVEVKNYGFEPVEDLILKVFMDDVQAATASLSFGAQASKTITFDLAFRLSEINRCKISFEEFPVTFDNEFYFTINSGDRLNVLEIKEVDIPTSITKVYGNKELFNLTSVHTDNLDYSLLTQNDLVVLNGITQIEPSLAAVLNERLARYGNVLVIPSKRPDLASYRQLHGLQTVTSADTLIDVELKTPDFSNPFFQNVFEEENKTIAMPSAKKILDWGADRTAILSLKNNTPFLGRPGASQYLYVLASPLDLEYSNFYTHALFVPVMYRLAVQSASQMSKLYYFIDDPIVTLKADTLVADDVVKLRSEEEEIIPSQRINANQMVIELPKNVLNAGFYDLVMGDTKITTLAFNKSFEESDLDQYSPEELKNEFIGNNVSVFDVSDRSDFSTELKNKYVGEPLWKQAILLALVFLLAEVLLIRFFP